MVIECTESPDLARAESWEAFPLAWSAAHEDLLGPLSEPADPAVAEFYARRKATLDLRILVSRMAPAALEGNGVDEAIYLRGDPANRGASAARAAPELIRAAGAGVARQPASAGTSGRLALAHAVTAPDNPLTARVWANRLWLQLFGRGLAPDPDNVGLLGRPPTHPELLDWLADRLVRVHHWHTKPLLRELVLSRTFRASSTPLAVSAEQDPLNLLWHRYPVRRLESEDLRDAVLAASGRLDLAMSGPSVPVFLTDFMEGRGRPALSGPMDGSGRRSLYVELRRNFLDPLLLAFDFPTPFTTIGKRSVSNVPAQALALMNDPLLDELSEAWATRLYFEPRSPRERLDRAWKQAFARAPDPGEIALCEEFLDDGGELSSLLHALLQAKEFQFVF